MWADEQFLAWYFFQMFWTVLDFLQKPLAWFSKIYLRVQSKISGRNNFFNISFQNFFQFWAKKFQTLAEKTSRSCQNYRLRVQTNNFWIEILFKSFEQFWIFCRNLWHGSQTSIFVSRVKIAEEMVFFVFLFRIFLEFWAKIFQNFGQKTSRSWQNYPLRVQTNNFWLEIFFKSFEPFWIFFGNFGMVLKLLSSCPEKKFRKKYFFYSSFQSFFRILSENFFRILAKKLQEVFKTTF